MYIANNAELIDLRGNSTHLGVGSLAYVGKAITIGGNPNLTSLAGLESLDEVGGAVSLFLHASASLSQACALSLNCTVHCRYKY